MEPDRFSSLVTRQLNKLEAARGLIPVFREGLATLDGAWSKLNANRLARWLIDKGVRCTEKGGKWWAETVSRVLYFHIETDKLRERTGAMESAMLADQVLSDDPEIRRKQILTVQSARKLKARLDDLNDTISPTITDAIMTFADRLDREADAVGQAIRQGFDLH